jgi:hypothetical protein
MLSRSVRASLWRVEPTLNFPFRLYHNAVAKITTIDSKGTPVSHDTSIMIGNPGESYIYVEPEVGEAMRRAVASQLRSGGAKHCETLPLQFNHRSLHFTHRKCPWK